MGRVKHIWSCFVKKNVAWFSIHTASVQVEVEPVGRWFEAYVKRRIRNTSASFQELEEEVESSEDEEDEELQLEEDPMLRTLDPKDWKVAGLY